jgi:cytochrome oxidase Cu insertion factor (SCO1/SenC/PrrC family)
LEKGIFESFGGCMMKIRQMMIACMILSSVVVASAELPQKGEADLSPTDLERVKVGGQAPGFTLGDMDGKSVSLSEFRGQKHVVLVFYRGYW